MKNRVVWFLTLLFLIAFTLRFYLIPENLFFGPEQGVDFLVVKNIVLNHTLTLIGAKTDINGIFHGPIYFYLAAIPFIFSNGNPVVISGFFILLNCFTVFLMYLLGKMYFNLRVGLIAASLFTFSYLSIVYPRWLSTHPIVIPLTCLFFIFLHKFLHGNNKSLLGVAITFGLIGQAEFLNYLFFTAILCLVIIRYWKKFISLTLSYTLLCFFILVVVSIGNYILFDMRHNFLISHSIVGLLKGSSGYYMNILSSLLLTTEVFFTFLSNLIFPLHRFAAVTIFLAGFLLLTVRVIRRKQDALIILLWVGIPFALLVIIKHNTLEQFFVATMAGILLLIAYFIEFIERKYRFLGMGILLIIIGVNISVWTQNIPHNRNIFFQSPQPDLKIGDQKKVIDEVYKRADKKPFSIQAYTIPYWIQQGWEYLFWYYGEQKYGYAPIPEKAKILFVIVQDDPSKAWFQRDWLKDTVSKWGKETDSFRYGVFTVKELHIE